MMETSMYPDQLLNVASCRNALGRIGTIIYSSIFPSPFLLPIPLPSSTSLPLPPSPRQPTPPQNIP